MLYNRLELVPLDSIEVKMEERQRSQLNDDHVQSLVADLQQRPLLYPIIIDKDTGKLLAGAHRLAAFKNLHERQLSCPWDYADWTKIPARYAKNLNDIERQALEYIENVRRKALDWKDEAKAALRIHRMFESENEKWTMTQTAEFLSVSTMHCSRCIQVGDALLTGHTRVGDATSIRSAFNIIERDQERALASEMDSILETPDPAEMQVDEGAGDDTTSVAEINLDGEIVPVASIQTAPRESAALPSPESVIREANFIEWVKEYSGPKFNFLHCDFPYGINHQKSEQGNIHQFGGYEDSPDVYWDLCAALVDNVDKILMRSCHIMFWFSLKWYRETLEFFESEMPGFSIQPFPMIWHKSDNKGLLPDPKRYGRRTYETALLLTRDDRKIVEPVALCYSGPGSKDIHVSEKNEPMLRHFFRMFVDEHTEMLDPTCGSGSALRAAESLKANRVLGLELNGEYCEKARSALIHARVRNQHAKV